MNKRYPYWLWPNLLSLDAPLVAVAWAWMFAQTVQVRYVESCSYWLLAGAIWCVYVVDRLLDVWRNKKDVEKMSRRHQFHWKFRWLLLLGVSVVAWKGVHGVLYVASDALLTAGIGGVFLVLLYFILALLNFEGRVAYVKNFLAALIFAYGVAATVLVEMIQLPGSFSEFYYQLEMVGEPGYAEVTEYQVFKSFIVNALDGVKVVFLGSVFVILFATLCYWNITGIDLWEASESADSEEESERYGAMLSSGLIGLVGICVAVAAMWLNEYERVYVYAIMVSCAVLHWVNRRREVFYLSALRVLADVALLVPLPLVWLMV